MFFLRFFICFFIYFPLFGQRCDYFIREANWQDRFAIIDLYKATSSYWQSCLTRSCDGLDLLDSSNLMMSIDEGFVFVVEDFSRRSKGEIIAFLIKRRPNYRSFYHTLDQELSVVCPDYDKDYFLSALYAYMFDSIENNHYDIFRVEATCSALDESRIALLTLSGYSLESARCGAILSSKNQLIDELVFVWKNRFFNSHT